MSPEYFLDKMSFGEIAALLKADDDKQKRNMELARVQWYYTVGNSKIKSPSDLVTFEWEKKPKKQGRKYTEAELKRSEEEAKKYLKNG